MNPEATVPVICARCSRPVIQWGELPPCECDRATETCGVTDSWDPENDRPLVVCNRERGHEPPHRETRDGEVWGEWGYAPHDG